MLKFSLIITALQNEDLKKILAVNLRGCVVDESAEGGKNPFEHTCLKQSEI